MQHFISDSKWSFRDVIDIATKQTSNTLPKRKLTGLIIDETGTVKKGDKSVGWQYCGNLAKWQIARGCSYGLFKQWRLCLNGRL